MQRVATHLPTWDGAIRAPPARTGTSFAEQDDFIELGEDVSDVSDDEASDASDHTDPAAGDAADVAEVDAALGMW